MSVIVPVFNTEKYLDQAIQSLLDQTYKNIEIILVDDHSTDKSWEISQKYADANTNVLMFRNTKNSGGPFRGRARGVHEARGEWITFMDCDDYVGPNYVENLIETTDHGRYDIAVTGHQRLHPDGREEKFLWSNYSQSTKDRMRTFYNHFIDRNFWTDPADTLGQNLVRASVAKKTNLTKYHDRIACEDSLMALAFLENSENGVNFVDHHDYYWRQREGSGSHGGFAETARLPDFYRASYDIFYKNNLLPLVSVIIPVYNADQYLGACIESVTGQIYQNIEIILVDDKSPDESGNIADSYSRIDSRIRVIHKSNNEGVNMARATGFSASSGEFVTFVDSDDLLTEDCIMVAITALFKNKTDFVRFGMLRFKYRKDVEPMLDSIPPDREVILMGKKDLYTTQFAPEKVTGDLLVFNMTVCGAIYPRRLIKKIDWKETNYRAYEDNIWTLRFLENISSCTNLGRIGYLYRSDESITGVSSKSLEGNSFNGKSIGYMEFWNYLWAEFRRYNKKYKIGTDETLESAIIYLNLVRAGYITKAGFWKIENNIEYLPGVIEMYEEKLDNCNKDNILKEARINDLESECIQTKNILASKQDELDSHLSIKRSAKLTLGNIKRRFGRNMSTGA